MIIIKMYPFCKAPEVIWYRVFGSACLHHIGPLRLSVWFVQCINLLRYYCMHIYSIYYLYLLISEPCMCHAEKQWLYYIWHLKQKMATLFLFWLGLEIKSSLNNLKCFWLWFVYIYRYMKLIAMYCVTINRSWPTWQRPDSWSNARFG